MLNTRPNTRVVIELTDYTPREAAEIVEAALARKFPKMGEREISVEAFELYATPGDVGAREAAD